MNITPVLPRRFPAGEPEEPDPCDRNSPANTRVSSTASWAKAAGRRSPRWLPQRLMACLEKGGKGSDIGRCCWLWENISI